MLSAFSLHPRPLDYIILTLVLAFSGFSHLYLPSGSSSKTCYIFKDGMPYERFSLDATSGHLCDTIVTASGTIIFETSERGVRVVQSSCRNKTCINRGYIKNPGESIVCVPNHCMAIIESKKKVFDAISE
ncbi:MAG: hypothetical protein A2268_09660 [Candidatus Raymondbacteria bacterium RifOxyA12_full_50_37]|uniref:Uncharacterized protein n=1 Tax=Candidatus Raymondbacteria bacterium RIFOXYD12_FULL_49_13 TaxID=1817890 RepID=A0A1F7F1D3_UNCRA|nr:MAG: hypothetical protein A2268_09660 [Candidatus Raymondbacteria bacterium RifOxyA12_full_50_37]OGJ93894.1 MAG: hypothetical protein A2248_06635 [Candidatus Raymondbacteria bacterium RIFOXYA2_FULL_49_16]OGJ98237.1 MAG: hypothetical protein A2453_00530 [Candidatus Raymondbacteria bacterium RIFOXYC2_FULL_50_21]OGK00470.1 MAG: hypothetical protein A2519_10705 [Candidatus Raymondbacteria bacterium RIFOXYD12_FULL_49_13]OGK05191.1 MAG: hypothetical protein A2487_08325 [Candidatus Raymondbacteria 